MDKTEKRLRAVERATLKLTKAFHEWNATFRHFNKMITELKEEEPSHVDFQTEVVCGSAPEVKQKIARLEAEGFFLSETRKERTDFFEADYFIMKRPLLFKWGKKK